MTANTDVLKTNVDIWWMISNVRTCVALKGLTIQHSRQGSVDGKDDEDDYEIDINEIEDDDDFVINFD